MDIAGDEVLYALIIGCNLGTRGRDDILFEQITSNEQNTVKFIRK